MNEIRLVKEDFKNKLVIKFLTYIMRKPYHSRMKDYKINKNLDFSKKKSIC